jgi:hypothetical protein
MKSNIQKERGSSRPVLSSFKPIDSFAGNDLATESFKETNGLSVSNKVARVLVRRASVVLSRKPVLKSCIVGLWLSGIIENRIAVPLARHGRCISRIAKQLWQRQLVFPQMNQMTTVFALGLVLLVGLWNPIKDASPIWASACQ